MKIFPFDIDTVSFELRADGIAILTLPCMGCIESGAAEDKDYIEETMIPWSDIEAFESWVKEAKEA